MEKEKTLENVNKKMTQVKFKKKIIVSNINLDFFEHFHDSLPRLTKDVSDLIFQFVGFKKTHPMIIKVNRLILALFITLLITYI